MSKTKTPSDLVHYYNSTTMIDYWIVLGMGKHYGMHFGYSETPQKEHPSLTLNRIMADKACIGNATRVLDAGCGVGGSAIWLAKDRSAYVIGITLPDMQVTKAKELAQRNGVSESTEFYKKDYLSTGFPSNSFDVVWAIESVCHTENKSDFIKEAYRLLKRGGCLIIADGFVKKKSLSLEEKKQLQYILDGWVLPNLSHTDDFLMNMKKAGFQKIEFEDITENVLPFSKWLASISRRLLPLARFLRFIRLFDQAQIENGLAAINQYPTLKAGIWQYGIVMGRK